MTLHPIILDHSPALRAIVETHPQVLGGLQQLTAYPRDASRLSAILAHYLWNLPDVDDSVMIHAVLDLVSINGFIQAILSAAGVEETN
ncbi:hypothetical protein [Pseudomonas sp. JBR1]|uniref:hypothetical protein n=1 Tax=Pseudomonas sp. JBR1 TaxID=3020907 RepID=UPI0023063837|nr:hypothetical protein [Pseudomonas sp. JBR1]WCE09509.1 hypothetical protein PJ259_04475 [Pseudomonas sp. JBR1]